MLERQYTSTNNGRGLGVPRINGDVGSPTQHSFDHKVRCASRHHQLAGSLAAVSDPTQLSVACSMEKQERAWYFFSRE